MLWKICKIRHEPKIEGLVHVIRNKTNEVERADNIFVSNDTKS